jgi:hypothetical protein
LVYHSPSGLLYVTVGSDSGPFSNSLLPLEPETGAFRPAFPIGARPGKSILSENSAYLYFVSETNRTIRRWNFSTNGIDLTIPVHADSAGQYTVEDIEVLPGSLDSLAVLRASFGFASELAIYDKTMVRPNVAGLFGDLYAERIEVGENPVRVYAPERRRSRLRSGGGNWGGRPTAGHDNGLEPALGWGGFSVGQRRLFTSYGPVIDPSIPANR